MNNDWPKRYGIYVANLDPTVGREIAKTRPVVVISRDELNRHLETVVVCPLTTSLHPSWRTRLGILCNGTPAEIAVDQVRTLSTKRLVREIDALSQADAVRLRALIADAYASA